MVEIYFGLTEKHIENFETIILHKGKNDKITQRILITDKNSNNSKFWDKIIYSNASFLQKGNNIAQDFYFMIRKIISYKKIINKIKIHKNESEIRIYLAYIEDILSNYLFFHFHEEPEVVIVEDGVLNYYDHTFKNVNKKRFYMKKMLASLFNIKYSKYQGHSSGIEYEKSKMQFLSLPDLAFIPKKVQPLPIKEILINQPENHLYIIGQENLIQIIGLSNYKKIFFKFIDDLVEYISTFEIHIIYYKPRNKSLDFEIEYLQKAFSNFKVVILANNLMAEEEYFKNIRSRYVASMISSALLTIYSKVSDKKKHGIEFIYKPVWDDKISILFEKLNFTKLVD